MLCKAGLPLANSLNILISSSPIAKKQPASTSKIIFVKVTAEGKKREKGTILNSLILTPFWHGEVGSEWLP